MRTVLEVKNVTKSYGAANVIKQCEFQINQGEIYGLLGVNGAGKTTLMKMMLGLQRIDSGNIYILGKEVTADCNQYLADVGSIIEQPIFYEHLTAKEILLMHLHYMKKQANISETLRLVGLDDVETKLISQYSLGMRQRLGFARAMIHQPKLLILDEPLNGLDPIAITQMRELMNKLANEGVSILLSSHIIGELRHTAHRIGILSKGRIAQEFSVAEQVKEHKEQFEDYVINLMKGN